MEAQNDAPGYHIWAIDNAAYGPVELPTLVNWIKEERVIANTWLFVERDGDWLRAADVPELKMFFKPKNGAGALPTSSTKSSAGFPPGALRRIKALAEMTDDQLAALLRFMEIVEVRPFTHVARKGDPPDAMYGVLEGELRSSIIVEGKECPLTTLGAGSIFGEISLFDKGPHAADVISNQESMLIKFSGQAIDRISKEAPDAALGLLSGLIKAIAGRVRILTRRYEGSVQAAQRAELPIAPPRHPAPVEA